MDWIMEWIMDSILDSSSAILMETMNGIGIHTFVQLSARLAGWFKPLLCSYNLPAQLVGKDS